MRTPAPVTGRPPTFAPRGLVTSSHYLASLAGVEMLRRGGSAVDAAIAVNAVLGVAYPHMAGGGIGGDGFWLIWDPAERRVSGINGSGPAGARATIDHYRARGHADAIPERGPLAVLTVPGAADGWRIAHERHGRLEWAELLEPAIRYAREGLAVARSLAEWFARCTDLLAHDGGLRRLFCRDGRPLAAGDRLAQPELAGTLELVARRGARDGFYEGELAERICAGVAPRGAPLDPADFAAYRAEWTTPIVARYRGREILEHAPNAQGFTALQILQLAERFDVAELGDGSADHLMMMAGAIALAQADREEWLADPRFIDIPLDRLLSPDYAAERSARIDLRRATGLDDAPPGIRFGPAARRVPPRGDTCAFCVADERGMIVSAISSIYLGFGSGEIPPGTGIILQNRGALFSLDERAANRLEPGKRPFHTLIPAMMCEGGVPTVAFGAMGGNGQPQTHAALVTRLVDFGYDVQQAIEAPRWVIGRTLSSAARQMWLEGRIGARIARELERRGQPVRRVSDWDSDMGHAHAIRICRERGLLEGGSDPRSDGAAIGY